MRIGNDLKFLPQPEASPNGGQKYAPNRAINRQPQRTWENAAKLYRKEERTLREVRERFLTNSLNALE
jgi:hypothetical protein